MSYNSTHNGAEIDDAVSKVKNGVPISNGGTGATTAKQARINLGIKPTQLRKLLWENTNPTSKFAAKTISLDLSKYTLISILSKYANDQNFILENICQVGSSCNLWQLANAGGTTLNYSTRRVNITSNSVEIEDAYRKVITSTSAGTINNIAVIPIAIYGISDIGTSFDDLDNVNIADYIIDQRTNGNWTYEKWNSGKIKLHYNGTYDSAFNNGNYFDAYRGTAQTINFPLTLTSVDYCDVKHISPNTGFCLVDTLTTSSVTFYPYNRTQQTEIQSGMKLMIKVVGRWK